MARWYGNPRQLLVQLAAVTAALVYSGAMSLILLKLINVVLPIRATMSDEMEGLDVTQHGEGAYIQGTGVAVATFAETSEMTPNIDAAPASSAY